jgi:hypothetical protein
MAELVVEFSTAAPAAWIDRWIVDRSKMICRLAHSPFSHGDYVLDDGNLLGASDNPGAPHVSGNPRGVAIRPPDYQAFALRRRAVIKTTDDHKRRYESFLRTQLGKPFDGEAVSLTTFLSADFTDRDWRDSARWYCHELLVHGYEVAGILGWKLINVKNRVTAADHLLIINPMIDPDKFWTEHLALPMKGPHAG